MSVATQGGHRPTLRRVAALNAESFRAGVLGRFRDVLQAQPGELAVTDATRELTFGQVAAEAAAVLAQVRQALGAAADATGATPSTIDAPDETGAPAGPPAGREPVGLLHAHAAGAVCAVLGIIASGHPLVVLDPKTPAGRLRMLTERVGLRFIVADQANVRLAGELVGTVLPAPIAVGPQGDAPPGARVESGEPDPIGERDLLAAAEALWANPPATTSAALLAFTSGSTGVPKVVANDHEMIVRDAWMNSIAAQAYDARDVIAHTLPIAFHAGLMVTVAGLLVGCTMKLYDVRSAGIGGLAAWLDESGATVMQASPGILRGFVGTRPLPGQLARLTALTLAGEAVHGKDVEQARALLPATCTVRNRYGSSETGLISDYPIPASAPAQQGPLPAGFAVGDSVLQIVDDTGRPVPAGEPGIVTITAPKVAMGYWGDPERTAAAFTANPDGTTTYRSNDVGRLEAGGLLRLLGRRDHSVKIRGYLVEPAEVDAALFALADVREALVVGLPRPSDGGMRLVAYVVSTSERPSAVSIRAALHATLPGYMVPETVVFLDALPRTDRGKLDRSALPEPPAIVAGRGAEALNEWESVVAGVWERVLALEIVGRNDDFFELGGDSLAAEQLMAALVSDIGVPEHDARTTLLAQAPTLAEFAARLRRRPEKGQQTLIPLQTAGSRPPLFLVAGAGGLGVGLVPLAKHLGPDQPTYALQAHALERRGVPDWSVQAAARRHVATIRSVQPHGPYHLGGHSFGGLVALEIAHQLKQAGQEVDLLVVLDSFPPEPALQPRPPKRSLLRRLRDGIGLLATGVVETPGLGQYWRFHRQSMLLSRFYRCPRWAGRTLVVVADSPEKGLRADWGPHLSGPWERMDIGGDHLAMMREPWAERISQAVARQLAAARAARG